MKSRHREEGVIEWLDGTGGKKAYFRPWYPGVIGLSINKGLLGVGKILLVHKKDIWFLFIVSEGRTV